MVEARRRNPRASSVLPLQREIAHTRSDASTTTLAGYLRSGMVGGSWNVGLLYCILNASLMERLWLWGEEEKWEAQMDL